MIDCSNMEMNGFESTRAKAGNRFVEVNEDKLVIGIRPCQYQKHENKSSSF